VVHSQPEDGKKVWLCHIPATDYHGGARWDLEEVFDSAEKADAWSRARKATTWIVVREVK
jgi:hypothetical protein